MPPCFYRISAKALIVNKQKEFLLCKEENGYWELPGGGLEFGETAEQCIAREIQEEMGLTVTSVASQPCYFTASQRNIGRNWISNVLYVTTVENYHFTPSDECIKIGWFTKETATQLELFSNVTVFIEQFNPKNH